MKRPIATTLFLLSFKAMAQSGCTLEVPPIPEVYEEISYSDQSETFALKNKKFLKLLEAKGYDNIKIVNDKDDRDDRIFMSLQIIRCEERSGLLSFSKEWACPPGANSYQFKALDDGRYYFVESSNRDVSKTFETLQEAQDDLLEEFRKTIPSCDDVKQYFTRPGDHPTFS